MNNNGEFINNLIEKRYSCTIVDSKWLQQHFPMLHDWMRGFMNSKNRVLIMNPVKSSISNGDSDNMVVKILINTHRNKYSIKATVLKNKDKWDGEHWINNSSLKCECTNLSSLFSSTVASGVYSKETWESIKESIIINEVSDLNFSVFD